MRRLHSTAALTSAVAAAAYLNAMQCAFVFDDTLAIVTNKDVAPDSTLSAVFTNDFWGKPLVAFDSHKSYRPLTILTFRAHTFFSNPPEPASFHAVNVALHAAVTYCVTLLASTLWPPPLLRRQLPLQPALLAGLLFAVHPVHVEAVTGTVGRAELLCALCCFASAACYAACATPTPLHWLTRFALGACAAVCFFLAVLSKETGVTLLGVLAVRELFVHSPRAHCGGGGSSSIAGALARISCLGGCACAYALMRLLLMRPPGATLSFASASLSTSELIRRAENPLTFVTDRSLWLLSMLRVNAEYARLMLWPSRLCIEYSYDCVPMAKSVDEAANVPPLLLLFAALAAALAALRNALMSGGGASGGTSGGATNAHARHTLVAAAWLLMPWLPISHVPLRLGTLVAERTLYLPSVGAVLLATNALRPLLTCSCAARPRARGRGDGAGHNGAGQAGDAAKAPAGSGRRRPSSRRRRTVSCAMGAGVGLLIGTLAARTLRRTLDWRTDESAFEAAIDACPRSAKLHQQMCTLRTGQGRLEEARAHCKRSTELDPEFCDVGKSKGFLALAQSDIGTAVAEFNASLPCAYTNLHSYRVLLSLYDFFYSRDPHNASLHEAMGSSQAVVGNAPFAARLLREAAALHLRKGDAPSALAAAARGAAYLRDEGEVAEESAEAALARRQANMREGCALSYWRAQALLAERRHAEALIAFQGVGYCQGYEALASAAATEVTRLVAWLKAQSHSDSTSSTSSSASSSAFSTATTASSTTSTTSATSAASTAVASTAAASAASTAAAPRVLLLTFHGGVAAAARWAAEQLGWSLHVPDLDETWLGGCDEERRTASGSAAEVDGQQPSGPYRFSEGRAACLWTENRLGARLAGYQLVIVGDTAPLAWPLLQAGWPERAAEAAEAEGEAEGEAPTGRQLTAGGGPRLLLWVCNRFDYGAVGEPAWYNLVRSLASRPSVTVVSSAPFEWKYAQHVRSAPLPSPAVLRPIGLQASSEASLPDPVPPSIDRPSTVFVLPKINEAKLDLAETLAARGVAVWTPGVWPSGMQRWGGPQAVRQFRAAVHIPYAPVTFALYEHATAGLLTFLPSPALLLKLYATRGLFFQSTPHDFVTTGHGTSHLSLGMLTSTDWYAPENAPCFIYFESLDDLDAQIRSTDYSTRRAALAAWADSHVNTTLRRWQMLDRFLVKGGEETPSNDA